MTAMDGPDGPGLIGVEREFPAGLTYWPWRLAATTHST
jgi:hypothetical protein